MSGLTIEVARNNPRTGEFEHTEEHIPGGAPLAPGSLPESCQCGRLDCVRRDRQP